jgi:hypothetical protein
MRKPVASRPIAVRGSVRRMAQAFRTELTVMIRPQSGLIAVTQSIGERLAAHAPV